MKNAIKCECMCMNQTCNPSPSTRHGKSNFHHSRIRSTAYPMWHSSNPQEDDSTLCGVGPSPLMLDAQPISARCVNKRIVAGNVAFSSTGCMSGALWG